MVVAASKAIGAWVDEDTELNSFLSDAQLWLFLYVSVDWFQRFLLVFLGLTPNHLTLVTCRAPELVPSHASLANSTANVRVFSDLPQDVDAELAVLHTQVQWQPLHFAEQDEPVNLPTPSSDPPPSSNPLGHSAGSRIKSAISPPFVPSIHPAEQASTDEVTLALVPVSSMTAGPACHRSVHKATVVVAASLAVRPCHLGSSFSLTDSPHRSPLALCKLEQARSLTRQG